MSEAKTTNLTDKKMRNDELYVLVTNQNKVVETLQQSVAMSQESISAFQSQLENFNTLAGAQNKYIETLQGEVNQLRGDVKSVSENFEAHGRKSDEFFNAVNEALDKATASSSTPVAPESSDVSERVAKIETLIGI